LNSGGHKAADYSTRPLASRVCWRLYDNRFLSAGLWLNWVCPPVLPASDTCSKEINMQIVTNVLAADEDDAPAIGESHCPLDQWSGIDAPGLDAIKLAFLHALLTCDTLQMSLDRYQPVYIAENETVVLRVAEAVLEKLAAFDEEALASVAYELAASAEFEEQQWAEDDVLGLLSALAELAQLAESQGQQLFIWQYLIQE
jgi:hypothetical protein